MTLAEELILVALNDETGRLHDIASGVMSLDLAVAGSLLMELALDGRIDTDTDALFALSPKPTGIAILDETLTEIGAAPERLSTDRWLHHLSARGPEFRERLIAMLIGRGILREVEKKLLWVFKFRTYPPTTGKEEREVKGRIMALLYGDDIPEPRDALLVGLLNASGLFRSLLSGPELLERQARIDQISNLEEISRTLGRSIRDFQLAIASAMVFGH
jgi:golgi phosphoprotein 3